MKELRELQSAVATWSQATFGNNVSKWTGYPQGSQCSLTGMVEEVGELITAIGRLNKATICRHQGRKGYDNVDKYNADRNDAVADIMIFLLDYCAREGIDLLTVTNEAWDKVVSKRTLENWEEHRHDEGGWSHSTARVGTNSGHGHAWERPDGVKARCGGLSFCELCRKDKELVDAAFANMGL